MITLKVQPFEAGAILVNEDGYTVASCSNPKTAEELARRFNCHEATLHALEKIVFEAQDSTPALFESSLGMIVLLAKAALNKARSVDIPATVP